MPASKGLTDTQIKNAKPGQKPFKLYDRDRLYLLVGTSGSKRWYWGYRSGDKDMTASLGKYPEIGLADARAARAQAAKAADQGQHPKPAKGADPLAPAQLIAGAPAPADLATDQGSLWALADEWLNKKTPGWGAGHAQKVRALLERYIRNSPLGAQQASEVTTGDLYALVTSVAVRADRQLVAGERKAEAPHNAIIVRRAVDAVFRLAIMKGLVKSNPMADLRAAEVIEKPAVRHNAKLGDNGLKALLAAVDAYGGQRLTKLAIELLMLTATRTIELRGADWQEIDFDNRVWNIPAQRMKRRIAHAVPLSSQALAVLEKLRIITSGKGWLFPNNRRPHDFMASTTINTALSNMGFGGENGNWFRAHGCRGTFSTWAYSKGHRTEAVEQQLAHLEPDETKRAYLQAEFWPERRQIMNEWGDYLQSLKAANDGANTA